MPETMPFSKAIEIAQHEERQISRISWDGIFLWVVFLREYVFRGEVCKMAGQMMRMEAAERLYEYVPNQDDMAAVDWYVL